MIPAKINTLFIQLSLDFTGKIIAVGFGEFLKHHFQINSSIYNLCPFLEATLEFLPKEELFLMSGMLITVENEEYNVEVELIKKDKEIKLLIQNQTETYKYVIELNQKRNDNFLIRGALAKKNKELEKLKRLAEKANEEKSRFLAVMSHEIRNPLNSILGYSEIISSETKNNKIYNYAKALITSSKNLLVIINDILDLSRFEAGKLVLIKEHFSIKEVLEININNFSIQYKNTNVKLDLIYDDNIPKVLIGDAVRVTQIISNLLSNAFKFTKKGSITIKVNVISKNKNKLILGFKIEDSGRGMTKTQFKKIFNEYQQTQISDYRVQAGAGLGLSIVQRLITAMKGEISVESELNIGTTFHFKIPFKIAENQKSKETALVKKENYDFTNIKILYADDDLLNQTIAKHLLTNVGVEITTANDGLEALQKIETENFNIILLDINMPNSSGEEVVAQNKAFKKLNATTPIIAITANTSSEDIKRYFSLGFSSVISKPYKAEDLLSTIALALNK